MAKILGRESKFVEKGTILGSWGVVFSRLSLQKVVRLDTFVGIHSVVFEKWNGKPIAFALGLLDDLEWSGAEHEKCQARRT